MLKLRPVTLVLSALAFAAMPARAQSDLPNPDLEEWVDTLGYPKPEGWWDSHNNWATVNNISSYGLNRTFVNVQSGNFAAQLITITGDVFGLDVFRKYIPGVLTNGEPFLDPAVQLLDEYGMGLDDVRGAQPFDGMLESWSGFYEYTPAAGGDTAWFLVRLYREGDLIGEGSLEVTEATTDWTAFEVPVTYTVAMTAPDSAFFYVASSVRGSAANDGSELFVDNMALTLEDTTSGIGTWAEQNGFTVRPFPNPAEAFVQFVNPYPQPAELAVYNARGVLVRQRTVASGRSQVALEGLATGLYTWRLSAGAVTVANGKLNVR